MSAPVIGVDLGGTKVLSRIVDPSTGATTGRAKVPTPRTGIDDVVDAIVGTVSTLDPDGEIGAVGVGVPGPVDDGVVLRCPNIAGWDAPYPLRDRLEQRLDRPVVVVNDVDAGAVAEHRLGAGRGTDDLLAVFVGTGVGGGLVLDGRLRTGPRGLAGEFGHLTVVENGRRCGCGGRGHLESYAGKAGLEAEARRRHAESPNHLIGLAQDGRIKSRHLAASIEAGDETTIALLDDAARALGSAIGSLATVVDLPLVVLGGGIVDRLGEAFVEQIRGHLDLGGFGADVVELVMAERLDDAGAVGAAALAADMLA